MNEADREIGAKVLGAMSRSKIPVTFADWHFVPQIEEWQFLIATPWYDSKGPLTTYRAFVEALKGSGIDKDTPTRRMTLRSPKDPLVEALRENLPREGFLHVLRNGDGLRVIYAPIVGAGGPVPARHFRGINELKAFLLDEVQVRPRAAEDAMDEAKASGSASIFPVILTKRRTKALGLG
ncbi:MAG TPA: hypothetical protein VMV31_06210 [Terriglobales bacterium]|nr:hypothetical protein [Terriglobales bacterium]